MDYVGIFIAVTSIAVVIQAGILVAMFVTVRKSTARVEELATQFNSKALPTIDLVNGILVELRPKIDTLMVNASETSNLIRAQIEHIDATVTELVDRARLQVIRTDEMVGRALDSVEATTDKVQRTVSIPVRQVSGLMRGITAGFEYLVQAKRSHGSAPQEELFI